MDRLTSRDRFILTRAVPMVVAILLVSTIGLALLVQRNSSNVDDLNDSVTNLETSTQRVENFVNDVEEETPTERERNEAITRAVQEVPQIKDILCGEFPEAAACQG